MELSERLGAHQVHEPESLSLDIVGQIEMRDDDGRPTGVYLLLERGMDAGQTARTFARNRCVDLGEVTLIRFPGESDAQFTTRVADAIQALV